MIDLDTAWKRRHPDNWVSVVSPSAWASDWCVTLHQLTGGFATFRAETLDEALQRARRAIDDNLPSEASP